jgi:hypothetical protein
VTDLGLREEEEHVRENSLPADKRLQGKPLGFHLRTFATSLLEDGYVRRILGLEKCHKIP